MYTRRKDDGQIQMKDSGSLGEKCVRSRLLLLNTLDTEKKKTTVLCCSNSVVTTVCCCHYDEGHSIVCNFCCRKKKRGNHCLQLNAQTADVHFSNIPIDFVCSLTTVTAEHHQPEHGKSPPGGNQCSESTNTRYAFKNSGPKLFIQRPLLFMAIHVWGYYTVIPTKLLFTMIIDF